MGHIRLTFIANSTQKKEKKMPLNVRRFYTSVLLVLVSFIAVSHAQTATPEAPAATLPAPTSGDVMRERISKAKAFIAVRNYNAAIYELENIRKESGDTAVQAVVNVLLMNSYLEQGDYKRAQDLLTEFYTIQKTTKPNASASYMSVAGQIIKSSRNRVERYRALGLSVSDRTLPLEATNDLEKMRETLELVITQSKEIGTNKVKTADAMMLLEEASTSRSMLGRDEYDARRWKDEVIDTREAMTNSRSVVLNAVNDPGAVPTDGNGAVTDEKTATIVPVVETKPAQTREREVKPPVSQPTDATVAKNEPLIYVPSAPPTKAEPAPTVLPTASKSTEPIDLGSALKNYATTQPPPVYPIAARSMRTVGMVTVEVTVDEQGQVAKVEKTTGPPMLQAAAQDAIKKWRFRPFVRDGQPVKATGFVNFNFKL